ncbi:MAG: response regulator [Steroidobacteraceae bacterium]
MSVLLSRDKGMKIVGCAATGVEAVLAAHHLRPDVIIMDLVLPALNGIDATRQIISELPRTRIIALSACHTSEHVYRALRMRAPIPAAAATRREATPGHGKGAYFY